MICPQSQKLEIGNVADSHNFAFSAMSMDRLSINIEQIVNDTKYIDYRLMEEYRMRNDSLIEGIRRPEIAPTVQSC